MNESQGWRIQQRSNILAPFHVPSPAIFLGRMWAAKLQMEIALANPVIQILPLPSRCRETSLIVVIAALQCKIEATCTLTFENSISLQKCSPSMLVFSFVHNVWKRFNHFTAHAKNKIKADWDDTERLDIIKFSLYSSVTIILLANYPTIYWCDRVMLKTTIPCKV